MFHISSKLNQKKHSVHLSNPHTFGDSTTTSIWSLATGPPLSVQKTYRVGILLHRGIHHFNILPQLRRGKLQQQPGRWHVGPSARCGRFFKGEKESKKTNLKDAKGGGNNSCEKRSLQGTSGQHIPPIPGSKTENHRLILSALPWEGI